MCFKADTISFVLVVRGTYFTVRAMLSAVLMHFLALFYVNIC